MSLYQDSVRLVTEHAPVKTDYCRCGTNAAAKVAAEQFLRSHAGPDLKLSFVRPAWIVGAGLIDPVGSAAWRLASGRLLILGDAHRQRPLIGRSVLHRAVSRLVAAAPGEDSEVLLLVDRDSPAQLEYLQGCCDLRAGGARAIACGSPVWMVLLLLRELHGGSAVTMRTWCRALSTIRQRRIRQRYDPSWTEARLAMSLATRWREELAGVEAD
jgi:nucleoside-diphosphate-sugar epimerase